MKAVKRMLLGIFFVLLGIFCTLFSVSFSGFELLELVALFSPLLGLGLVLFGFFPRIDLYCYNVNNRVKHASQACFSRTHA